MSRPWVNAAQRSEDRIMLRVSSASAAHRRQMTLSRGTRGRRSRTGECKFLRRRCAPPSRRLSQVAGDGIAGEARDWPRRRPPRPRRRHRVGLSDRDRRGIFHLGAPCGWSRNSRGRSDRAGAVLSHPLKIRRQAPHQVEHGRDDVVVEPRRGLWQNWKAFRTAASPVRRRQRKRPAALLLRRVRARRPVYRTTATRAAPTARESNWPGSLCADPADAAIAAESVATARAQPWRTPRD
jgi:hypothetical protein